MVSERCKWFFYPTITSLETTQNFHKMFTVMKSFQAWAFGWIIYEHRSFILSWKTWAPFRFRRSFDFASSRYLGRLLLRPRSLDSSPCVPCSSGRTCCKLWQALATRKRYKNEQSLLKLHFYEIFQGFPTYPREYLNIIWTTRRILFWGRKVSRISRPTFFEVSNGNPLGACWSVVMVFCWADPAD